MMTTPRKILSASSVVAIATTLFATSALATDTAAPAAPPEAQAQRTVADATQETTAANQQKKEFTYVFTPSFQPVIDRLNPRPFKNWDMHGSSLMQPGMEIGSREPIGMLLGGLIGLFAEQVLAQLESDEISDSASVFIGMQRLGIFCSPVERKIKRANLPELVQPAAWYIMEENEAGETVLRDADFKVDGPAISEDYCYGRYRREAEMAGFPSWIF